MKTSPGSGTCEVVIMANKKYWIVFQTCCGAFVSSQKLTKEEAAEIFRRPPTESDFTEAFGLWHSENFVYGYVYGERWTLRDAENYALCDNIKRLESLRLQVKKTFEEV